MRRGAAILIPDKTSPVCPPNAVWSDTEHLKDQIVTTPKFSETLHLPDKASLVQPQFSETLHLPEVRLASVPSATATKPDTVHLPDSPKATTVLQDALHLPEKLSLVQPQFSETLHLPDKFSATQVTALKDTLHLPDTFPEVKFTGLVWPRSGTPDADRGGDGWIDQANAGVNHGNETPLIAKGSVLNDARNAFIEFDFTTGWLVNLTRLAGGVHSFVFSVAHDAAAGANTLGFNVFTKATRPFTESTLTWNTTPTGTALFSGTVSVAAGAAQTFTVTITDANMATILGNWVYVQFGSQATLPATNFNISSREAAAALRPSFNVELTR